MNRRDAVDEKTMVKNGLSVTAGAGAASFGKTSTWRAGETYVTEAPGNPVVATLEVFYRDSFFLALREETCCHGTCAHAPASADTLRSAAISLKASGSGGSHMRNKLVEEVRTRESLSRKRARPADEGPIDLTQDD